MTINDCPFCGGAADLLVAQVRSETRLTPQFRVDCLNEDCEAKGPMKPTQWRAIGAWNTATSGPDEVDWR